MLLSKSSWLKRNHLLPPPVLCKGVSGNGSFYSIALSSVMVKAVGVRVKQKEVQTSLRLLLISVFQRLRPREQQKLIVFPLRF
jgi:hypothetical protein